ncbi:hypothetical protein PgNI_05227 [Pyricularia grisea]|uniref:Uncharacterized protein n=1 Tax=Pyricularia grisea TaxID=148305 RepID=A0A6P8B3Q9_PYRGI|nr:hypothetical protein PgNI_05227 [Pyricularia grisea]TLD09880.1 hypothetical protein PgNI_05227 [Pyricularia grisea]
MPSNARSFCLRLRYSVCLPSPRCMSDCQPSEAKFSCGFSRRK